MKLKAEILNRRFDEPAGGVIAAAVNNDPSEWMARHGEVLRRYALARVNNPFTAEELVQDTFAAALQNQDRFMGRSAEQTWLVGILRHKILDHYRRNSREQRTFDRSIAWDDFDTPETRSPDARERIATDERRAAFWSALEIGLAALPKRTADAFRMVEIEELDTDTACARLGVSKSNLWVMLHRARKQLRNYLRDMAPSATAPQALFQVA
jgi:RNA polymerase sigma-70 factor (ECF subfamily)